MKYNALLVDDERIARSRLDKMLQSYQTVISVVGQAENGFQAIELIDTLNPHLVFLDIEMPGMGGFEVLQNISTQPKIIFTTAYDEFALKAFEENSVDYLIKPIHPLRLEKAINKLDKWSSFAALQQVATQFAQTKPVQPITTLSVNVGNKILLVKVEDISALKAEDKYVTLFDKQGNKHIIAQSLNTLETVLPNNFIRVHRAYIINKNEITEIRKTFNSRYLFIMQGIAQENITTGTNYIAPVKKLLSL